MKMHPVGAELFHVDRRTDGHTDMTKLIVSLHDFTNVPNVHNLHYRRGFISCRTESSLLASENPLAECCVGT